LFRQAHQPSSIQNGNLVDITVFKKEIDAGAAAMREAMETVTPFGGAESAARKLERRTFKSNRTAALSSCLSIGFSQNRYPLLGPML
jgi:hypothetical protein